MTSDDRTRESMEDQSGNPLVPLKLRESTVRLERLMEEELSCARNRERTALSSSSSTVCIKYEPDDTEEEKPVVSSIRLSCSHCQEILVEGRTVYKRKRCPDLFCSAPCLSAANRECHNCLKLIERPQDLIIAPVDDKGSTKSFCCNTCLSSFNHKRTIINKIALQPQVSQPFCSMCNRHCISKHDVPLNGVVHKMCSDDCLVRFHTAKNLTVSCCANCDSYCLNNIITLNLHDENRTFCSDECLTTFKRKVKTSSACTICKTYMQTSDMFDAKNGSNVALLCSRSCVMAYKIQAASVSDVPYPCDNCGNTTLPAYHVALSNESIKNFCSLPCAMAFQTNSLKAVATNTPTTSSSSSSSSGKTMRNKALLCKPMVQDVGVSCTTQVVNSEAQTDVYNFPKVIFVPVPVPVFIPVPVNLFTSKPPSLPVQECPKGSRLPKIGNGPTSSQAGNDQVDDVAAFNSDDSCGGDPLLDSDSESISKNIAEEISTWTKPLQIGTEKFDDTPAFSSDESFSGDYVPDSALHSDSETLDNKQKLSRLKNTPTASKSFGDLTEDNEMMDGDNERDAMSNPAPSSTSPPQKRPRGRPPKRNNDPMSNPAPSPPQKRSRGRPPKRNNPVDTTAAISDESCSEESEFIPDRDPEPCNDSDSSSSLSAINKQRRPRLRKSTINKRLPSESVGEKTLTEKNIVTQEQETYFTTKNYCYVCGKAQSKIARHLKMRHKKTEPDVAKAFSLHKNSKERKRLLDTLRNRGNHKHNQEVLDKQCGMLKLRKKHKGEGKPPSGFHATCPYCKCMFVRRALWRHMRICSAKPDGEVPPAVKNIVPQEQESDTTNKRGRPRSRKSTINTRLPSESVGGKILTEKNIVPQELETYTTKNYCYVCGKAQSKMARHLLTRHKTEPDVAKAFSLGKDSKERKRLLGNLRDRGNHKHNQEVLDKKSGTLKLKRRHVWNVTHGVSQSRLHATCPYCKGMYSRRTLCRHMRMCSAKPDDAVLPTRRGAVGFAVLAQSTLSSQYSPETLKLLQSMRQDEVAFAIQNDVQILELAQDLCAKHCNDPNTNVPGYLRDTLRALGKLTLTMKKKESLLSIKDAVKPNSVDKVIEAMKEVSGFNEQSQSYQKPSLAFRIELGLTKLCDIILSTTKAADDEQAVEEVQTFKQVFASKWAEHAPQPETLPSQVIKPSTIPFTHDVQLLYKYLQKKAAEAIENLKKEESPYTYAALVKVTLAQISIVNKLHTSEISKMTVESFMGRGQAVDHTETPFLLSELKQKLGTHWSKVDMECRYGRRVTALLTPDACSAVMLLLEKRIACDVIESNPFVFARPKCDSPYLGQESIRMYASECGAQRPELLRSRYFRKHVGTLFHILNLQNYELYHLGTCFDCNIRADRDYYQLPEAALEMAKISKLVQAMELGHLGEFKGKSLDEIEIDDEIEPDMARNIADNSGEGENEESHHPHQLKGKRTRMTQAEPTTSSQEEPSTSTGQAKHVEAPDALSTRRNKRPLTVPFTHDVQLLYQYLQKKAAEALESLKREDSQQIYSELAKVTLAQIMLFNKLHESEVSEMTIKNFMERTWAEVHDTDTAFVLSEFEQKLCTHFSRVDITCKNGSKVAVLLNADIDNAVMLLVQKRVTCGVSVSNPILFVYPLVLGRYYNGQNCIQTFAKECGALFPEYLISRCFRKHVGRLFHILNLKNHELCKLATLLDCYIRPDRDYYQLPEGALEMSKISKLVQEMDQGYFWNFQGKSLEELEIDDEMEPDLAWDSESDSDSDDEGEDESVQPVQLKAKPREKLDVVTSSKDRVKQKKTKWEEEEVNAIMKHFKEHISKGKLASVTESRQCRAAEYATLKGRTVQNIRDFVRNRGIMLRRSK